MDFVAFGQKYLGSDVFVDYRNRLAQNKSRQYDVGIRPTGIAIHHTAAPTTPDTPLEVIADYHVYSKGWAGIGYHIAVQRGKVYYVGTIDTIRANVWGRNHELIGVVLIGDYEKYTPTETDIRTLEATVSMLDAWFGKALEIRGHNDWALPGHGTTCPGRYMYSVVNHLKTRNWKRPPNPGQFTLDEQIKQHVLKRLNVPVNPDAYFYKFATRNKLGIAVTPEFDTSINGQTYRIQMYQGGIVYAPVVGGNVVIDSTKLVTV